MTGKLVAPLIYEIPDSYMNLVFQEGMAIVTRNGKFGYINSMGEEISSPQWDTAGRFKNGNASVSKNGKYTLIDYNGKPISEPVWDNEYYFNKDGLASVELGDVNSIINRQGQTLYSTVTIRDELIKYGINPDEKIKLSIPDEEGYSRLRVNRSPLEYYIDREGKILSFSKGYTLIHEFINGQATVYDGPVQYTISYASATTDDVMEATKQRAEERGCLEICSKTPEFEVAGGSYHIIEPNGNILFSYPKSVTTYKNIHYFTWDELGPPLDYIGIVDEGGQYGVVALRVN